MMKVIRNADGVVINIGDWDFMYDMAEDGRLIANNPMPSGTTEQDEEVIVGWDGGLYALDDSRAVKQ